MPHLPSSFCLISPFCASYFENRMITRLRSRVLPLPAARSASESKVNIYYRRRVPLPRYISLPLSRDPPLQRRWRGRRRFKDEGGESELRRGALTVRKGRGAVERERARTHTEAYTALGAIVCRKTCGGAARRNGVSARLVIRIRNLFLPRGSTTTTSSYILLCPSVILPRFSLPLPSALPAVRRDLADPTTTRCVRSRFQRE